ncbi:aldo/keto reductase [Sphingobium sp. Sx8-8]|uniref:aldo/keto reductase n=1 Tax=Sphingobium sp. Sx8-8 TaxID=2933617 RepID=UPI001F5AC624|nr:aldo/keto reductase [Sphingobium sp. Sx8-8]
MKYNRLGSTGLYVSEICLGTMTFGGGEASQWQVMGSLTQEAATAMTARALEAGVNFFDTANAYHGGRSEEILAEALRQTGTRRIDVVLATKVCRDMGTGPNDRGISRHHILDQVDASLKRLGTDHIDLYQLHAEDADTPLEETLRALDDVVRAGKVRYIGVSNWPAWRIARAQGVARAKGWSTFETVQAYYSVAGRDVEREIVPMAQEEGLGLLVWSPLAGGLLSGKYDGTSEQGRRARLNFPPVEPARLDAALAAMRPMAQERGCSVAAVALAWLLHQAQVSSVIVGATRLEQLDDNLAATQVELSAEDLQQLAAACPLPREYPNWGGVRGPASRRPAPFRPS